MTGTGAQTPPVPPPVPPHLPVLLGPLLRAAGPISGVWLDGTFGAGGYARGLLEAGADVVIGVDRDPLAFELAAPWAAAFGDRLILVPGTFSELDEHAAAAGYPALDGVALDLGVSSMQLDRAERGFSFLRDGPVDMRMGQEGPSAADLVNEAPEALLADIIHYYGEERAARRIARAIVAERAKAPIETTLRLAGIVESCLPRKKPGQIHPATRTFQGLRIAVNDELGQLVAALAAAERALKPGGKLAVVTFHSIEDRNRQALPRRARLRRRRRLPPCARRGPARSRFRAHAEKGHRAGRGRDRGKTPARGPPSCAWPPAPTPRPRPWTPPVSGCRRSGGSPDARAADLPCRAGGHRAGLLGLFPDHPDAEPRSAMSNVSSARSAPSGSRLSGPARGMGLSQPSRPAARTGVFQLRSGSSFCRWCPSSSAPWRNCPCRGPSPIRWSSLRVFFC